MQYAVLAVDARTDHGDEVCRVASQAVALSIASLLRYEEARERDADTGKVRRVKKYERVTTMKVFGNGNMRPVVVR